MEKEKVLVMQDKSMNLVSAIRFKSISTQEVMRRNVVLGAVWNGEIRYGKVR